MSRTRSIALSPRGILVGAPQSTALHALHTATSPDARGWRFYGLNGPGGLMSCPSCFLRFRSSSTLDVGHGQVGRLRSMWLPLAKRPRTA